MQMRDWPRMQKKSSGFWSTSDEIRCAKMLLQVLLTRVDQNAKGNMNGRRPSYILLQDAF